MGSSGTYVPHLCGCGCYGLTVGVVRGSSGLYMTLLCVCGYHVLTVGDGRGFQVIPTNLHNAVRVQLQRILSHDASPYVMPLLTSYPCVLTDQKLLSFSCVREAAYIYACLCPSCITHSRTQHTRNMCSYRCLHTRTCNFFNSNGHGMGRHAQIKAIFDEKRQKCGIGV